MTRKNWPAWYLRISHSVPGGPLHWPSLFDFNTTNLGLRHRLCARVETTYHTLRRFRCASTGSCLEVKKLLAIGFRLQASGTPHLVSSHSPSWLSQRQPISVLGRRATPRSCPPVSLSLCLCSPSDSDYPPNARLLCDTACDTALLHCSDATGKVSVFVSTDSSARPTDFSCHVVSPQRVLRLGASLTNPLQRPRVLDV